METGERGRGKASSEEIHIEDVFPKYPWQNIRENMVNYLQQLGSWMSLIIGIYGIICLIKSLMSCIQLSIYIIIFSHISHYCSMF